MFLLETEAKILENTLRWISWTIEGTRRGNNTNLKTAIVKETLIISTVTIHFGFGMGPNMKTIDDIIKKIFREVWKNADIDTKTTLAKDFFELELINTRSALADECIKEQREVQKILFSTRNKKLAIKYIDQMYDENDNSFEKRLAVAKAGEDWLFKSSDHAIEISYKNAIDSAFRILTLKLHPDKGGDAELFKILQEMRDHLLYVDLGLDDIFSINDWSKVISSFRVDVELDFQVTRKLLQGKPIPKNWRPFFEKRSENWFREAADDGVDTSHFL